METNNLILIEQFCEHHSIEISFINSLNEFGLIDVVIVNDDKYLAHDQLNEVEKMIRLHYELDINMEGIDTISNLLKKINNMQTELITIQNKLKIYED
jgi:hypothetical protein